MPVSAPALKLLAGDDADRRAVQAVLEDARAYYLLATGAPARPNEAEELFRDGPPGRSLEDKRVYGIYVEDALIGCADVFLRWPTDAVAMIGLFVLRASLHRRGHGRAAYRALEEALGRLGFSRVRIAVLRENEGAFAFWRRLGFVETGERKPYVDGTVRTEAVLFEKDVA